MFPAAGKILVHFPDDFIQILQKNTASPDNLLPVIQKLIIPYIQCHGKRRVVCNLTKQLVALLQHLVVMIQIVQIGFIQLTQLHVHKTSSLGGTILYDGKILR